MTKPFKAELGARGFQLSNPPIFQAASLLASLEIFNDVGMQQLRAKSIMLTAYLQLLLQQIDGISFITPTDPNQRGCQISILVEGSAEAMFHALENRCFIALQQRPRAHSSSSGVANMNGVSRGVVCDIRRPCVIRVAPTPLYNTFDEVRRFAAILRTAQQEL
jgi:kynureninase